MDASSELLTRASEATSLQDFGDESFREGLDVLVRAAKREANLNGMGQAAFEQEIVGLLINRLRIEDTYRRHPEIDEQQIVAPLIGLGLPRTGSTALSCLLAADPAARSLRLWESNSPCPPPEAETQHSDPRIAEAEEAMRFTDQVFPRLAAMVPSTATGPMECQMIMGLDLKSQAFQSTFWIPSYVDWLNNSADLVPTYRYVKRVLKLLQWRCPPTQWRLKNPSHSLFISALDEVFPDARFWMTHRDIADVLPSLADLYFELQRPFTDRVDLPALGRLTTDFCELGMRRMIAFRAEGNDHRFCDIHFASLQDDPFSALAGLYDFLGEKMTDAARAAMRHWLNDSQTDRLNVDRTSPSAFGLESDALRQRFRFYRDRFAVPAMHPVSS